MEDPRLHRLFTSLGASFEAQIARDEEEAAHDLAFSLRQGRALGEILERGPWLLITPGGPRRVRAVGNDFVVAGGVPALVAPLDRGVFEAGRGGDNPATVSGTFLQLLRSQAREGATVEMGHEAGRLSGRLLWAGTDHVAVETARSHTVVALRAIEWISFEEGV